MISGLSGRITPHAETISKVLVVSSMLLFVTTVALIGIAQAGQVQCPALLILGERDMLTPVRSATKVAEALPHAEKVVLGGSGHALLSERPDPVLDQLIRVV